MKDRSFSEEELRQREKEERSRRRKQEQAYREAQRGVYSRIYEEQDAMPEDYRRALWDDPQDEYDDYDDGYDGADREIRYDAYYHAPRDEDEWTRGPSEDWTDERRRIQEELGGRRDRPGRQPLAEENDEWQPIVASQRTGPLPDRKAYEAYDSYEAEEEDDDVPPPPPPRKKRPGTEDVPERPRPKKRKKRKRILLTVLLVLLALVAAGFVVHQIYVRPPDLRPATRPARRPAPTPAAWGSAGRRTCTPSFWWAGTTAAAATPTL